MAFSAIRIGGYETVKQKYTELTGAATSLGLLGVRIAAGVTTGVLAILAAQPTDVVKIRMQAELRKPGEVSRYNGVMDAYRTVFANEGFRGLYKGDENLPEAFREHYILIIWQYGLYMGLKNTFFNDLLADKLVLGSDFFFVE